MRYKVIGEYGPIAAMIESAIIEAVSADEARHIFAEEIKTNFPAMWKNMGMHNIYAMPYVEPAKPKGPRYQITSGPVGSTELWNIVDTASGETIVKMHGPQSAIAALAAAETLNKGFAYDGWTRRLSELEHKP